MAEAPVEEVKPKPPMNIMDLPEKIWGSIFEQLEKHQMFPNYRDVNNIRLVCKAWKAEIDNHYEWEVNLDDRSPHFEYVLNLRFKSCYIRNYTKPSPLGPETICKFPTAVKNLWKFPVDQYKISLQNLHLMLKSCANNLEDVYLYLTESLLNEPCTSNSLNDKGYNFKSLQKLFLVLKFDRNFDHHVGTPPINYPESTLFYKIITHSSFSKLEYLKICIQLGSKKLCSLSSSVMSFEILASVIKLSATLKHLEYSHSIDNDNPEPDDLEILQSIDVEILKKVNSLETFSVYLNKNASFVLENIWRSFLESQKKIVCLIVSRITISSTFFSNLVHYNFETLKIIDLQDLEVVHRLFIEGVEVPGFDLSILEDCSNLTKLRLRPTVNNLWALQNLSRSPKTLEHLDVEHFSILSEDLLTFSSGQRNLKYVSISVTDTLGPTYGVTGSVLENFMNTDLHINLKTIDIGGFNVSNPVELSKFLAILQPFEKFYYIALGNDRVYMYRIMNIITGEWGIWELR